MIQAMARAMLQSELFLSIGLALFSSLFARPARAQKAGALQSDFKAAASDYNSGQLAKAASELESLARRAPENPDVEELLGMVLSAESKDREASIHLRRAVQLKPGWAAARANLAVNLTKLGKNSLAEAEFKRAIAIDPADSQAYQDLGQFYLTEGKVSEAIPALEKAQTLHPSYRNGYNLALAYSQTGRPQEAKREIQELIETNNTAELHNLLGEVDEKLGDFIAAANEFQHAAQMDPTESNLFDWGTELLVHHALGPAIEVFSLSVKRYPGSARLVVGLGLAYYWRGDYDEAVKALLQATSLAPSDPRAYYFLSKAYNRAPSQAREVISCFCRFADLRPHDGKAQFYYA
ncbi:MAG: tetratricopeptide repeat protein, partial [Terriglobia bacterium]